MFAVAYRNTMAGAKRIVRDSEIDLAPKPKRDRLVEISRKWTADQEARKRKARADQERIAVGAKPAELIAMVARRRGVTVADILGRSRVYAVVAARDEAIAEVFTKCRMHGDRPYSLTEVGRVFNRDHTTILHSLQKTGIKPARGRGWMNWPTGDAA